MNKELKAKWVEALRSGKYKQGKGKLRNKAGEFCCLGVLCEVAGLTFKREKYIFENGRSDNQMIVGDLLDEVEGTGTTARALSQMNDEEGADFSVLASYIEANL